MEWRIFFEPDGSRVTVTVTGAARVDGFRPYLEALLGDPAWRAGTPVLVDFRGLDIGQLNFAAAEQVLAVHLPYVARIGKSPIAVVVSRPVDFGMMRMWGGLSDGKFPVPQIFYEAADALRWLNTPGPGDSGGSADGSP